jgi:hypothetical protein
VKVANGNVITSTHIDTITAPDGSIVKAHLFPNIETSLLSISEFIDHGYTVIYEKHAVKFVKDNQIVFTGHRDINTRLWMVDLSIFNNSKNMASPAIQINSIVEFVRYWHACFCYPPKSTFIRALVSFLKIPDLTATNARKHLPSCNS